MDIWLLLYDYTDDMTGGVDSVWSTKALADEQRIQRLSDPEIDSFMYYTIMRFTIDDPGSFVFEPIESGSM